MSLKEDIARFGLIPAVGARLFRRLEQHLGLNIWFINIERLSATYDVPAEHAARFTFKRLTSEEALRASENPELDLPADFVRDGFDRGDICVGAFEANNLVAYIWRGMALTPVSDNLWLRIHGPAYYSYKGHILPEYRGIRLINSVGRFYDHWFVSEGIHWNIGWVALSNLPSMRYTKRDPGRMGIGYAGFLQRGSHCWTFRTPRVREYLSFETPQ